MKRLGSIVLARPASIENTQSNRALSVNAQSGALKLLLEFAYKITGPHKQPIVSG